MARWGHLWGPTPWGKDGVALEPWEQGGGPRQAKEDTRYLALSETATDADLATDLSQYGTDITIGSGGGFFYEDGDESRWEVVTTRCIELLFETRADDEGYLWRHGNQSLRVGANDEIIGTVNGTDEITVTIPGLVAADHDVLVCWSTEPNPLTTGAGDALRSELHAVNLTTNQHVQAVETHPEISTAGATAVWFAQDDSGTNQHDGTLYSMRFSERFHPIDEAFADFVYDEAVPSIDGVVRREMPVLFDVASGVGDPDHLAGPVYSTVAADSRKNDLILASPIVSWVDRDKGRFPADLDGHQHQTIAAPGSGDYMILGWTSAERVIPMTVNRLKVRAHIGLFDESDKTIKLRFYSMNRPPSVQQMFALEPVPLLTYFFSSAELTANHGAGDHAGEWVDFGLTRIALDAIGRTYLCLAMEAGDASTGVGVNALTVDPVLVVDEDAGAGAGGIGFGF